MVFKIMNRFRLIALILGVLMAWPSARADTPGVQHFQSVTAIRHEALAGDAAAQSELGHLYEDGTGITKDFGQALHWTQLAAAQGDAGAQHRLGMMYFYGKGTKRNDATAFGWLLKSARQGNAAAEAQVGYMYGLGLGVPEDEHAALQWATKSAAQGNYKGENNLGKIYMEGEGVKVDYGRALDLFKRSAKKSSVAQASLGFMYFNGLAVQKDCRTAVALYRQSIEQNDPSGENNLAVAYFLGCGVDQSNVEALKWALIAARSIKAVPYEMTTANIRKIEQNVVNLKERMTPDQIQSATEAARSWVRPVH
jgi:TPR repeat protein